MKARVEERARRGTDPSDADLSVLEWQLAQDEPFESGESRFVVRVSSEDPRVVDIALTQLQPLLQRLAPFNTVTA